MAQMYRLYSPARAKSPVMTPARYAAIPFHQHEKLLTLHAASWRFAAAVSAILCTGLSTALWAATGGRSNPIQVFAADQSVLASAWGQAVPPLVGWLSFPAQLGQSVSPAGRHMTGGEHEFAQAQHQLSNEGTWNATAQTDGITTAL